MSADPRLPELFERASALVGDARRRFLADLAQGEPALAREIAELLAAAPRGERLDTPAAARLALAATPGPSAGPPRVGPYRIVREIGRGGMGRVFLAEQEAEGFRRSVALKLLDRPAADEDDVRRFRDEVRILASLEHPGIARFLDGGRSSEGVWFLALEYVDGVDLIEYARRAGLDTEAKLRLFRGVLEAVAFVHAHGVLHRDLKPGNLLVGADGRPRLLDFGLSKLLDPESGDSTVTRTESRALTPAYASPEQFRGERATVASDVFSLGIVLYELVAGRRPFGDPSSSRAALERAVLEQEAEPPSAAAQALADAADSTATTRPAARPRLGRDLDAICLRALRKEPGERYPTVAALAADLDRHLAGEAVEARRGERLYRARRFVARHRLAAAIAALLALAGLAFAASRPTAAPAQSPASRLAALEALDALPIAELERRFAAMPADLRLGSLLATNLAAAGRGQEAALVVGRLRQLPGGTSDPLVDYADSVVATHVDESQRALAIVTRALARAEATGRAELVPRLRAAHARHLSDLGQSEAAHRELERARREAEALGDSATLLRTLNDLAIEHLQNNELAAGERLLELAFPIARRLRDDRLTASILHNLGGVAMQRGSFALASERLLQAADYGRRAGSERHRAVALGDRALALWELGRTAEVDAPLDEALATLRDSGDHTSLAYLLTYRATIDLERGRLVDVEPRAAEIEGEARASGNRSALGLAEFLRGRAAAARGATAAAGASLARAERILDENGDLDLAGEVAVERARLGLATGDRASARSILERAATTGAGAEPDEMSFQAAALLALVEARSGELADAERGLAALGAAAEGHEGVRGRLDWRRARAAIASARGQDDRARSELETALSEALASGRELEANGLRRDLAGRLAPPA